MKPRVVFYVALILSLLSARSYSQTLTGSLVHGGLTRNYRIHIPPGYTGTSPVPLVFNLHGYTSNAMQQEIYSGMNAIADTAGFLVCYPDGINNSWNSGFTLPYNSGVDDVGFLSVLIDSLSARYSINPARIYACGMSNGGYMSYRLACDLEQRIAAVASVTGSMTIIQANFCSVTRPVPVLEIHGTNDSTVAYAGTPSSLGTDSVFRFWSGRNQCAGPVVHDTLPDIVQEGSRVTTQWQYACQGNTEVALYKIDGGGHTWPGSGISLPGANTNQDIKASEEIWKFFSRFVHPAPLITAREPEPDARIGICPNPATHSVTVSGLETCAGAELIHGHGAVVANWDVVGSSWIIPVDDLPDGVYRLRFFTRSGLVIRTVVIMH